ncbi:response regulator transcription factor [Oceanisphaera arctica]|uniref:DNA-binding response regulator n=1 Tax=Oceanisphaera arctica TaxID=641510 RepID=A0A2P5TMB5_9GAMM|nr:response regulator transcription factor [Oceanisphaera arctica]PPL16578.1 DNA-binding response regulator [Oceanisphaera arctica]GHA11045.1 DNA-binding response regulator [Oceanisphaera arctica]
MRILVVEDNPDILVNIVDYLTLKHCVVDALYNGAAALNQIRQQEYDLLVLDLSLPGMDGLALCRQLRAEQNPLPVVMLTARDTLNDKLGGFEVGADDYLVKPFALPELWSRIQAVLKRSQKQQVRRMQVADVTLDLDSRQASRGGHLLSLNPKCLKLLEILMRYSPNVVSRESLFDQLWADDPPDSDGLKSHIYLLRSQLDKPFDRALLQTVHGQGYRLVAGDD